MRKALRWLGYDPRRDLCPGLAVRGLGVVRLGRGSLGRRTRRRRSGLRAPSAAQLADAGAPGADPRLLNCHGERLEGRMMFDAGRSPGSGRPTSPSSPRAPATSSSPPRSARASAMTARALFVMPSPMYSRLSDEEVAALIAYIRAAPRVGERVSGIEWGPIGRFALAKGDLAFGDRPVEDFRVRQPFDTGPANAAGRRLAATSCSECHGPDLSGGQPTPDVQRAGPFDRRRLRSRPVHPRCCGPGGRPSGRDLGLMREVARARSQPADRRGDRPAPRLSAGARAAGGTAKKSSGLPSGGGRRNMVNDSPGGGCHEFASSPPSCALLAAGIGLAAFAPPRGRCAEAYRVARGDTLSVIARRCRSNVTAIARASGIANPNLILVGQLLVIPGVRGATAALALPSTPLSARSPAARAARGAATAYRFERGDTLYSLARWSRVSVPALLAANPGVRSFADRDRRRDQAARRRRTAAIRPGPRARPGASCGRSSTCRPAGPCTVGGAGAGAGAAARRRSRRPPARAGRNVILPGSGRIRAWAASRPSGPYICRRGRHS